MSAILGTQSGLDSDDTANIDEAWRTELRRRIAEIRSGEVPLLTWAESWNGLEAMLNEMRVP